MTTRLPFQHPDTDRCLPLEVPDKPDDFVICEFDTTPVLIDAESHDIDCRFETTRRGGAIVVKEGTVFAGCTRHEWPGGNIEDHAVGLSSLLDLGNLVLARQSLTTGEYQYLGPSGVWEAITGSTQVRVAAELWVGFMPNRDPSGPVSSIGFRVVNVMLSEKGIQRVDAHTGEAGEFRDYKCDIPTKEHLDELERHAGFAFSEDEDYVRAVGAISVASINPASYAATLAQIRCEDLVDDRTDTPGRQKELECRFEVHVERVYDQQDEVDDLKLFVQSGTMYKDCEVHEWLARRVPDVRFFGSGAFKSSVDSLVPYSRAEDGGLLVPNTGGGWHPPPNYAAGVPIRIEVWVGYAPSIENPIVFRAYKVTEKEDRTIEYEPLDLADVVGKFKHDTCKATPEELYLWLRNNAPEIMQHIRSSRDIAEIKEDLSGPGSDMVVDVEHLANILGSDSGGFYVQQVYCGDVEVELDLLDEEDEPCRYPASLVAAGPPDNRSYDLHVGAGTMHTSCGDYEWFPGRPSARGVLMGDVQTLLGSVLPFQQRDDDTYRVLEGGPQWRNAQDGDVLWLELWVGYAPTWDLPIGFRIYKAVYNSETGRVDKEVATDEDLLAKLRELGCDLADADDIRAILQDLGYNRTTSRFISAHVVNSVSAGGDDILFDAHEVARLVKNNNDNPQIIQISCEDAEEPEIPIDVPTIDDCRFFTRIFREGADDYKLHVGIGTMHAPCGDHTWLPEFPKDIDHQVGSIKPVIDSMLSYRITTSGDYQVRDAGSGNWRSPADGEVLWAEMWVGYAPTWELPVGFRIYKFVYRASGGFAYIEQEETDSGDLIGKHRKDKCDPVSKDLMDEMREEAPFLFRGNGLMARNEFEQVSPGDDNILFDSHAVARIFIAAGSGNPAVEQISCEDASAQEGDGVGVGLYDLVPEPGCRFATRLVQQGEDDYVLFVNHGTVFLSCDRSEWIGDYLDDADKLSGFSQLNTALQSLAIGSEEGEEDRIELWSTLNLDDEDYPVGFRLYLVQRTIDEGEEGDGPVVRIERTALNTSDTSADISIESCAPIEGSQLNHLKLSPEARVSAEDPLRPDVHHVANIVAVPGADAGSERFAVVQIDCEDAHFDQVLAAIEEFFRRIPARESRIDGPLKGGPDSAGDKFELDFFKLPWTEECKFKITMVQVGSEIHLHMSPGTVYALGKEYKWPGGFVQDTSGNPVKVTGEHTVWLVFNPVNPGPQHATYISAAVHPLSAQAPKYYADDFCVLHLANIHEIEEEDGSDPAVYAVEQLSCEDFYGYTPPYSFAANMRNDQLEVGPGFVVAFDQVGTFNGQGVSPGSASGTKYIIGEVTISGGSPSLNLVPQDELPTEFYDPDDKKYSLVCFVLKSYQTGSGENKWYIAESCINSVLVVSASGLDIEPPAATNRYYFYMWIPDAGNPDGGYMDWVSSGSGDPDSIPYIKDGGKDLGWLKAGSSNQFHVVTVNANGRFEVGWQRMATR